MAVGPKKTPVSCHPERSEGSAFQEQPTYLASASATKSSRSCPQNISPPTKNVGAPNTPRATASSVLFLSCSFTAGSFTRDWKVSTSIPDRKSTRLNSSHLV